MDDETAAELEQGGVEELIHLSNDNMGVPELPRPTPRNSITSTALIDDFSRILYKISGNLGGMRVMCDRLGGPEDSHDHRAKLNALTEVTKDMIIRANIDLCQLGQQGILMLNDVEKLRLTRMTREFQSTMGRFQEIQRKSMEKCRDFVVKAQAIARDSAQSSPIMEEEEQSDEESKLLSSPNQQQRKDLLGLENEISYNQALIQEREQGIQEIETAMAEVHELFCDLGLLVSDQQGVLDNIEANIEASAVRTRAAVRELVIARDNQRKRRGNICFILFLALFVFIIAIAVISAIL